jgi:uncharacterized protein YjgD (DUF1641 family)
MEDSNIQHQIDDINRKLDLVLDGINAQKRSREEVDDLFSDISLISKDLFSSTVKTLDNAGVELDSDTISNFILKLLRNIETFNELLSMMESAMDLIKDVTPIVGEIGLNTINKVAELEEKGYLAMLKELGIFAQRFADNFTIEDLKKLSDSSDTIATTVKSITNPELLGALNKTVAIYNDMDKDNIPEYSLWKTFKALRTPEMKRTLGFVMTLTQNIAKK